VLSAQIAPPDDPERRQARPAPAGFVVKNG
jgi:hypothetical protein